MKYISKGFKIKIILTVVIILILAAAGYLAYNHFIGKNVNHEVTDNVDVIKERLENTAELNTGSYLCTDIITRADSKTFKDWKIPFTEKSFIVQYDGIVKAGIKDLTKAQVTKKGNTIIVKLPPVEITGADIDNDSFEKLDESNNIFNPISVEDLNEAQKDLKAKMYERAIDKGVLDLAKSNAEAVLTGMLQSTDGEYEIKIQWQ